MKISLIGSGNVGTHLAKALNEAGHEIKEIWSRDMTHAQRLAEVVGATATTDLCALKRDVDIYIIAVTDDSIAEVAKRLPKTEAIVAHTSGTVELDALGEVSKNRAVMWFPHSFVREKTMEYGNLTCCIETEEKNCAQMVEKLVGSIASKVYRMNGEQRKWAHLASVVANNFVNALNAMSEELMKEHGLPFEIVRPLIAETARKAMEVENLWTQQTGPAARGDRNTMERHRRMLQGNTDALEAYDAITRMIEGRPINGR